MEIKAYEFKGSDVESAIKDGLSELNITRENAEIEVVSKGGFLSKATVRITPKEVKISKMQELLDEEDYIPTFDELKNGVTEPQQRNDFRNGNQRDSRNGRDNRNGRNNYNRDDRNQREARPESAERKMAREYLEQILSYMPVKARIDSRETREEILLFIGGENANFFVGRHGEFLDAIQYLVNARVNGDKDEGDNIRRVTIDADFYRERRRKSLTAYAMKMVRQAVATGKEVHLDAMNSYERRIIHAALQNNPEAQTKSEGEGRDRHIVITPKVETINYGGSGEFKKTGPTKTRSFGYNKTVF